MNKKYEKSYKIWLLIINSASFLGGIIDALCWIPYGTSGGQGGFPIFSLLGIYAGSILGVIYSLINLKNKNALKEEKIKQVKIALCNVFFPIAPFVGVIIGWGIGYVLVKFLNIGLSII